MARLRSVRVPRRRERVSIAVSYFQAIRRILYYTRGLVKDRLLPKLPEWAADFKRDTAEDEADRMIEQIAEDVFRQFPNERIRDMANLHGQRATEAQRDDWHRQVRSVVGIDILTPEPDLRLRMRTFAAENAALIRSLPERTLNEIESLVMRALQAGTRHEDIAQTIEERFDVAEERAALIARDQLQKLVAEVDRERQEAAGVSKFVWRAANDERVRDSHAAVDGQTFLWEDPPTIDGEVAIPGSPINCRCTAEPILDGLIDAL